MTARQIRAYLAQAERLAAAERLEDAMVAMVPYQDREGAQRIMDHWRFALGTTPRQEVRDGQVVNTIGMWKVLTKEQTEAFWQAKAKAKAAAPAPNKE